MIIKNLSEAAHLQRRLGIGVEYSSAKSLIGNDLNLILEHFIPIHYEYKIDPSISSLEYAIKYFNASTKEKLILRKQRQTELQLLINWWLERIHHTRYPLQERMVIFWHGHFTSSSKKVSWPQLMFRQNQFLRTHSLGSFSNLLMGIYADPAMLIYLDAQKNIKNRPNENFARELLELFTLGEGHYTENDVVNAARAFTGLRYNYRQGSIEFLDKRHDNGTKHFLGRTGRFNADDIISILLEQPRTAEFITEKFWKHFINPDSPDKRYINYWAKLFRDSNYHIPVLLNAIIQSEPFWAENNRGTLIKSPIEFTIGLLRELGLNHFNAYSRLRSINKLMGQQLFYPPDVKGWRGDKRWISNERFVLRDDYVNKMEKEHSKNMYKNDFISNMNAKELSEWLLPILDTNKKVGTDDTLLNLLQSPAYQLR